MALGSTTYRKTSVDRVADGGSGSLEGVWLSIEHMEVVAELERGVEFERELLELGSRIELPLVVSGGHNTAYDAMCDAVASR